MRLSRCIYLRYKLPRKKKYILMFLLMTVILNYSGIVVINGCNFLFKKSFNPVTRRNVEALLQESLRVDRGTGCDIPKLDPFDKELMRFSETVSNIRCEGFDWVRCHLSKCTVRKEILLKYNFVSCNYQDIIFVSDKESRLSSSKMVDGYAEYLLKESDHVKVSCSGYNTDSWFSVLFPSKWSGYALGFRSSVSRVTPKLGREDTLNIMILGFDSTSKNGFIRRMPKSYKTLKDDIGAVILNGYNILGDGTPAAFFPMLTGKNELELPERRAYYSNEYLDDFPFIFFKLHKDGYRTAYFEDAPDVGTFQYRFNGFLNQPTDHYLRHFFLHVNNHKPVHFLNDKLKYCVGDTPSYLLMMNTAEQNYSTGSVLRGFGLFHQKFILTLLFQFFKLDGKKFILTFISDITHNNFNMISCADDDLSSWLKRFKERGHLENTMLIIMGDHGVRFGPARDTLVGKLEERLPLMAIRLPERIKRNDAEALKHLEHNANVLTTAYDVHVTLLDVMGLPDDTQLERARSLLQKIPSNRSCSEAGIESHWCACMQWTTVPQSDPICEKVGQALVNYINSLTEEVRFKCHPRTLKSVDYVQRRSLNKQMLKFSNSADRDGYYPVFNSDTKNQKQEYTVKITADPNGAIYEASLRYLLEKDIFQVDMESISRTNEYILETGCISATHPHLNKYCFCKNL